MFVLKSTYRHVQASLNAVIKSKTKLRQLNSLLTNEVSELKRKVALLETSKKGQWSEEFQKSMERGR